MSSVSTGVAVRMNSVEVGIWVDVWVGGVTVGELYGLDVAVVSEAEISVIVGCTGCKFSEEQPETRNIKNNRRMINFIRLVLISLGIKVNRRASLVRAKKETSIGF